jgi:hypothetical protein
MNEKMKQMGPIRGGTNRTRALMKRPNILRLEFMADEKHCQRESPHHVLGNKSPEG